MPATNFPNGIVAPILQSDGTQQAAITDLTDSSGGSTDGTLAAVSGSGADVAINNNFADVAAQLAALNAALQAAGITDS